MIDYSTTGYCTPRRTAMTAMSFCHSCMAAFTPTPRISIVFQPPPMQIHYYNSILSSTKHKKSVDNPVVPWGIHSVGVSTMPSCEHERLPNNAFKFSGTSLFGSIIESTSTSNKKIKGETQQQQHPRIAIIGGGIAGVTAANALSKKFASDNIIDASIVIFEGDVEGGDRCVDFGKGEQPTWTAATARNANSLVPGAAMHVMSQRKTLFKIAKDTTREWYSEQVESIQQWLRKNVDYEMTKNIDSFDVVPPYFAMHLFRCIGPSATWDERATFVTFLKKFVLTSLLSGEEEADERGRYIQQLAQSNRYSFLEAINGGENGKALATKIGLGKGFLSLHRSSEDAIHAFKEGQLFGETTFMMPSDEATKLEPRISNLPFRVTAVHRIDDYTANSALFVQDLIKKIKARGVEYRCGNIGMIEDISQVKHENEKKKNTTKHANNLLATAPAQQMSGFKVTTKDGSTHDFDYVVLAVGVQTPLLARQLGVGDACPTYPLRGYSLTIYTNHTSEHDGNGRMEKGRSSNLLNIPISVDDMYCSSVGANMARMAGFGELVGYRDKAVEVPSVAPRVMSRYAEALFPESDVKEENALQCFRPCSPDDIPIVGEVRGNRGLYMHTGHGTLGWTLCLATSECLAQALHDDIMCTEAKSTYKLPGNIEVERDKLSPNRFL